MTETTRKRAPKGESKEPKVKKVIEREAPPASSPEARERQLISLAVDLAERQLRDGTASPSVINHYLKLGSTRESIEREMLGKQAKMLEAKVEHMVKATEQEEITKKALEAMKNYTSRS